MFFEPSFSQLELDNFTLKLLYNSIFFPRKLIQRLEDSDTGKSGGKDSEKEYNHTEEHLYILLILESLSDVGNRTESSLKDLASAFEVFRSWFCTQDSNFVNINTLHFYLKQVKPNHPFLLYLRGQNASISIHVKEDPKSPAQITIFQPSSKNVTHLENAYDLSNIYPKACFLLSDNSILESLGFSKFLANLANFSNEVSKSTTMKKNSKTEELRDSFSPELVYHWLLPCCCIDKSEDFVQVIKKYRDHVVCDLKGAPFRRSGMWLTAKIFLNILLVEQLGDRKGKAIYKALIINSHFILAKLISTEIEVDYEIIQKLAKRLQKLKRLEQEIPIIYDVLEREIEGFIMSRRGIMDLMFKGTVLRSRSEKALLNPYQIKLTDKFHNFGNLITKIESKLIKPRDFSNSQKSNRKFLRLGLDSKVPSSDIFKNITSDLLVLNDFESWVKFTLNPNEEFKSHVLQIFKVLMPYIDAAKQIYKENPLGYSRMILTASKIILVIDSIASEKYPLLLEHQLGIDPEFFSLLLLPTLSDVKYAQEIFNYFLKRQRAKYPYLLESTRASKNLFAYRYCKNLKEFKDLKQKIYQQEEDDKESKRKEVNKSVEEYKSLLSEINSLNCKYERNWSGNSYHSNNCLKCDKANQARNMTIEIYEKLLPEIQIEKKLVIFELIVPEMIANLRDSINIYRNVILEESNKTMQIKGVWNTENRLKNFSNHVEMSVTLKSTVNSFKNTHFSRLNISNNQSSNDYIKPNGYNLVYAEKSFTIGSNCFEKNIKTYLTFQNEGNYKKLQWVLMENSYSENQAISKQGDCPIEMNKKEYIKYSLFRAGLNLQLYNLFDAVETRVLQLKKKSVVNLICQSLWEVGPLCECEHNSITFTIFQELLSSGVYLDQLHISLSSLLDTCIENWNEHLVLLNVIVIVLRVISFTLSQMQREKFISLLLRTRKIGTDWQKKIEDMLMISGNLPETLKNKTKNKLLEICCICILTYNVEKEYLKLIMKSNQDIICFFLSITKIYDYTILYGFSKKPLKENLLSWTKETILGLESYLIETLQQNIASLHDFLFIKWPDSIKCKKSTSFNYNPETYSIIYIAQTDKEISKTIEIGLDGAFLIDGQPVSKLPREIITHRLFVRLFENTDFDIFPSTESLNSKTTNWISLESNLKYSYVFTYNSSDKDIIQIKETRDYKGQVAELEFVPHEFFVNILPYALIEDYSHWLDRYEDKIYFRAKNFRKSSFSYEKYFILDLNRRTIEESSKKRLLVNINSECFREFYSKVGFRMEKEEHIHIFLHPGTQQISIDFARFNIGFELSVDRSEILSKEFRGLKISEDQQIQTLIGLEDGLVLIDTRNDSDITKKKLIIPHGIVNFYHSDDHQSIKIETNQIKNPPFFIYEIDTRFGVLRAGESNAAWLYLAYLHAVTTSIMPDPFLRMPGTSRALEILQSPHTFSCTTLTTESYDILEMISELSPVREYVPPNLKTVEKVSWCKYISSYASHDVFIFLAEKLKNESLRFDNSEIDESEIKINALYEKSYGRVLSLNYKLSADYENLINESNFKQDFLPCFGIEINWNQNSINSARKINFENTTVCHFKLISDKLKKLSSLSWKSKMSSEIKLPNYSASFWIDISKNLIDYWIDLYEFCRSCPKEEMLGIKYGLALSAYLGADIELIEFFVVVLENQSHFNLLKVPEHVEYLNLWQNNINIQEINNIIKSQGVSKRDFSYQKYREYSKKGIKTTYIREMKENFDQINQQIINSWPNKQVQVGNNSFFNYQNINTQASQLFFKWFKNLEFSNFLDQLKAVCDNFPEVSNIKLKEVYIKNPSGFDFPPFELHLQSNLEASISIDSLKKARKIYETGHYLDETFLEVADIKSSSKTEEIPDFPLTSHSTSNLELSLITDLTKSWNEHFKHKNSKKPLKIIKNLENRLRNFLFLYKKQSKEFYKILESSVFSSNKFNSIFRATLSLPELTATEIQKQVLSSSSPSFKLNDDQIIICGAICVLWTLEQRIERCLSYLHSGESQSLALSRELENVPYENWSPKQEPGWLVLQIELDMMIRPVQVEVAKAMLFPQNKKNQVTQLNMGEGKTSLILPMIAMANKNSLLRITVLKSLFNINRSSLTQKLGGVLNRRVYILPCSRDTCFDEERIKMIDYLLKECQNKKGIFLTLPEYRLSFKLKGLELSRSTLKDEQDFGERMVSIEKWLELNCRDVIDESDEILSPKYQLVYTIGQQSQICCGKLRWQVIQAVLELAKNHFLELEQCYGDTAVSLEISSNLVAYPYFRLLSSDAYEDLCKKICLDILRGRAKQINFFEMKDIEIEVVSKYILNKEVNLETREKLKKIISKDSENYEIITILRGIFCFDIVLSAFSKRWRVNYGVNIKSEYLKQAVPYRAKDVPAERAQFAHPDISIMQTLLSYYYSGLTNEQLDQVFGILKHDPFPESEYESWILSIPKGVPIDNSIKSLKGVNLSEFHQKFDILYPLLRMHTSVINYWLNKCVFPKEAKEFSSKLSNSAWDLCPEKSLMTGFSGTNDSRFLLPLNTEFFEISELSGTNGSLIENLLLPENNSYFSMHAGISTQGILELISAVNPNLKLLLDVGALMLELDNKSLVQQWLKLRPDLEAGVFFDEKDEIKVIDRKEAVVSFEMSPYKFHLQACVIYLDDSHTRGTDLKIPKGTIGAVTLGRGLTKDRLMQACMRMRMLGKGHQVSFFACHEVDYAIQKLGSNIGSKEVMEWTIKNTNEMIADQFLYWAVQGLSFYRRLQIYENYLLKNDLKQYSLLYEEHEASDIMSLYEPDRIKMPLTEILKEKFLNTSNWLKAKEGNSSLFDQRAKQIIDVIDKNIGTLNVFSQLFDEEREIELEVEKEEEVQKDNKKSANPVKPEISSQLEKFISTGIVPKSSNQFIHLGQGFSSSSVKNDSQPEAWSKRIYLTHDYLNTVTKDLDGDSYLKPPKWICYNSSIENGDLVIISSFEANHFIKKFSEESTSLGLFMPRSRVDQKLIFSRYRLEIPQELLQQIGVFSGSMFLDKYEIDEYLNFTGYCPSPRSMIEHQLYNFGMIESCGYVLPENRLRVFGHNKCLFVINPSNLIIKIAEIRNYGIVSRFSHYFEIFQNGRRPFN